MLGFNDKSVEKGREVTGEVAVDRPTSRLLSVWKAGRKVVAQTLRSKLDLSPGTKVTPEQIHQNLDFYSGQYIEGIKTNPRARKNPYLGQQQHRIWVDAKLNDEDQTVVTFTRQPDQFGKIIGFGYLQMTLPNQEDNEPIFVADGEQKFYSRSGIKLWMHTAAVQLEQTVNAWGDMPELALVTG